MTGTATRKALRSISLLAALVVVALMATSAFAEREGKYKIGKKTYNYFSETRGQQTAYIFEPDLPDDLQAVYAAVRFGISLTYSTELLSEEPDIADVQGVKLLKFRERNGRYVLVTLVRNEKNRVTAFSMFESYK